MSIWRPNYQFNTTTYTIEPGITSVEITGATGGSGTLTLPSISTNEIGVGYTITISDFGSNINGLVIQPNPSDSGYKINGDNSVTTYISGTVLKVSYEGFSSWVLIAGDATDATKTFGIVIDAGDSVITTGIKGDLVIPYNLKILSWQILADQTGSIELDIWKDTYANFPPVVGDSIIGGGYPSISASNKNTSSSLGSWVTTEIQRNDILRFNVRSVSSIKRATFTLTAKII
jgi:hypothetical protein